MGQGAKHNDGDPVFQHDQVGNKCSCETTQKNKAKNLEM